MINTTGFTQVKTRIFITRPIFKGVAGYSQSRLSKALLSVLNWSIIYRQHELINRSNITNLLRTKNERDGMIRQRDGPGYTLITLYAKLLIGKGHDR